MSALIAGLASSASTSLAPAAASAAAPPHGAVERFKALMKAPVAGADHGAANGTNPLQGMLQDAAQAIDAAGSRYQAAIKPSAALARGVDAVSLLQLQEELSEASIQIKVVSAVAINACKDFAELARGGGS